MKYSEFLGKKENLLKLKGNDSGEAVVTVETKCVEQSKFFKGVLEEIDNSADSISLNIPHEVLKLHIHLLSLLSKAPYYVEKTLKALSI